MVVWLFPRSHALYPVTLFSESGLSHVTSLGQQACSKLEVSGDLKKHADISFPAL